MGTQRFAPQPRSSPGPKSFAVAAEQQTSTAATTRAMRRPAVGEPPSRFDPSTGAGARRFPGESRVLDARSFELDDGHLVEIRRLDGEADRGGQLLPPLDELLLGFLRGLLALPQQDRPGSPVRRVVERDVAGEAVVL